MTVREAISSCRITNWRCDVAWQPSPDGSHFADIQVSDKRSGRADIDGPIPALTCLLALGDWELIVDPTGIPAQIMVTSVNSASGHGTLIWRRLKPVQGVEP